MFWLAVNDRHVIADEEKLLKHSQAHCFLYTDNFIFLHVTLFMMHLKIATVAEKEFDIVIPMTLERLLVQRLKKKEISEKKK